MSEMFDDILSRRANIRGAHDAEREHRDRLAREAAVRATNEIQNEEYYGGEAKRMGLELAGLLECHGVQPKPVYAQGAQGLVIVERGEGWHVFSIKTFEGTDAEPGTLKFILTKDGDIGTYTSDSVVVAGASGKKLNGICLPRLQAGSRAYRELNGENIKNGIASLIETGQPYSDNTVYHV